MPVNSKNSASPPLLPPEHVIFTDLDGIDGVLVDLNAKQYYVLNETASLIWRSLAKGMPLEDIARDVADVYDVTVAHAQASVEKAVGTFSTHRLLQGHV
jgi:Coenzyme PQQ synthesis protein D (PqqD)